MKEVIVIGGGASGLVSAIVAAREGYRVTILEHKDKLGKKILATGNGKCNYTNLSQQKDDYRSDNVGFPYPFIKRFTEKDTIEFFKELGIYPKEKNGYVYPYSEQSASVVNVLQMELDKLGVKIKLSTKVTKIHKKDNKFRILTDKGTIEGDRVILATGGSASSNLGSDGSGFILAKELGHRIIKPLPALVQLVSKDKYFKTLAGVRCQGSISLYGNNRLLIKESGEILMANYGLSGIPILQISRYASKALDRFEKVHVLLDFMPELTTEEVYHLLTNRVKNGQNKNVEEMFIGLFNHKLAYVMLLASKLDVTTPCGRLKDKDITVLVKQIKEFYVSITDTQSLDQAQVSCGGIDTREIDEFTLESKKVKGLYLVGEVCDVDGTCGGYNLQWAWASGYIAAKSLKTNGNKGK